MLKRSLVTLGRSFLSPSSKPSANKFLQANMSKLVYSKYGNPLEVLALEKDAVSQQLKQGEVHVKVLYSPINPSDLLTIQGQYPARPALPSTPGNEGVAEVVKSSSGNLKPGDRVMVRRKFFGFWRHEGIVTEDEVMKITNKLPAEAAATLIVNPCTAYLMVKRIVYLKPGDVIIQNAANSALGQVVIQLSKALGYKTVNVVRNRSNLQETVDILKDFGADFVITDEQLKKGWKSLNLNVPKPKLALDAVGGSASADLASSLENGGTLAVYGVLSSQPVQVNQMELIFRNIQVNGFWLTKWIAERPAEFAQVMQEVAELYITGKLKMPKFRKFTLDQWQEAVKTAMAGFTNEKVLLQMNRPSKL